MPKICEFHGIAIYIHRDEHGSPHFHAVYGGNEQMPFRETDKADTQMSIYAATKKATESMAHSYAHLFGIPTTMFRFFTVYGPWGRPDLALFKFVDAILDGRPIDIYNHGDMKRDFTFVGDLVRDGGWPALGGVIATALDISMGHLLKQTSGAGATVTSAPSRARNAATPGTSSRSTPGPAWKSTLSTTGSSRPRTSLKCSAT